jgi:hypothetical protein
MSQFDPATPSNVPPGGVLAYDGKTFSHHEANQTAVAILNSTISASTATAVENFGCKGAFFVLNVAGYPGSASTTLALKLMTTDPVTATFASRAAVSANGAVMFHVYPGISASVGGVSCPLPRNFTARISVSTGATSIGMAISLTMMRIV